jgi:hypothetical protein
MIEWEIMVLHERIYELQHAIELKVKAIRDGNFELWRGCQMCTNEFFNGRPGSPSREEFRIIRSAFDRS